MSKRKTKLTWIVPSIFLVFLQACPGTRTGNPGTSDFIVTSSGQSAVVAKNSPLKFLWDFISPQALSLPPPSSIVDASGTYNVDLGAAWISLKEVEFKLSEVGSEESEIAFQGPYYVDLLSDPPQSLGDLSSVGTGPFKRVKFKLEREGTPPADAPAGMSGRSLFLSGTLTGGSLSNETFSYAAADSSEFEVAGPNGVETASGKDLILSLRLAQVLSQIDLTELASAGDRAIRDENRIPDLTSPCPLIDSSANDLFTCFRKGFEKSANFGKDDDGDFELGDTEDKVTDD